MVVNRCGNSVFRDSTVGPSRGAKEGSNSIGIHRTLFCGIIYDT